ncbi:facilitated trehalose transporter Tret1-like isoform X2 [Andrena cerasifolii]|uniref:facilitated trehalose transporter Tret1-like isoform X2 n=1 Tax=Andrena cerasifolii TaxID=2819439 RepID=UPI004037D331
MIEEAHEKLAGKVTWPQWIGGIGVALLVCQTGFMGGWSSPYIAKLTSPGSSLPITMTEASWVASLLNFGRPFGAIGGALSANYLGSKTTVLINSVPIALCWLFTIVANSVEWLYVSRLLGGISLGMAYSCFSLYLGEIADPSIRGALVALGVIGMPFGNFLMALMGAYLSMRTSGIICLAPCLTLMVIFVWLPESPHHLVKKKLDEKAKASIRWYHRNCDVESEFMALKKFVENANEQSFVNTLKEFRDARFRKSLSIIIMLFMYSQLCGINSIVFYMETILISTKVAVIEPAQIVIIVMVFGIVGSALSMFLMDRFGRKILMIASSAGVTISLCILTLDFQLLSFGFDPKTMEGLPIFAMISLYLAVFMGIFAVPAAVLSEIFPSHQKCMAACIGSCVSGVCAFLASATYLPLLDLMTEQYIFLLYALLILTAVPYTIFFIPETKGMSLQEIQTQLIQKR